MLQSATTFVAKTFFVLQSWNEMKKKLYIRMFNNMYLTGKKLIKNFVCITFINLNVVVN